MLYPGCKCHHTQVVCVHYCIYVSCQSQRERSQRYALRESTACSRPLDIHSRPARWLTNGTNNFFVSFSKTLYQTHSCSRLSFTKWSWCDCSHIYIFSIRLITKSVNSLVKINLSYIMPVRKQFILLNTQLLRQLINGLHSSLRIFRYLPIRMFSGI